MLSVLDALRHLGYDEHDEVTSREVAEELEEAKQYLRGAVGEDLFDLLPEDPRIRTLLKAYLDDLHDERGTHSAKAANAKRDMIASTEWQLRLSLSRKREEAAGE